MNEKEKCQSVGNLIADFGEQMKAKREKENTDPQVLCLVCGYGLGRKSVQPQPCARCEHEKAKRRGEEEAQKHRFDCVPPRYRKAEMSPSLRERLIACLLSGAGPHVITLAGPPNVGKTWNACGLWRHCVDHEIKVRFWLVSDLMIYLASLWRDEDKNPYNRIESLEEFSGLLILDDLGKEKLTESAAQNLFAILNNRIMWDRPTLITTNLPWTAKVGIDSVESVYGKAWLWRLEPGYVPMTERR